MPTRCLLLIFTLLAVVWSGKAANEGETWEANKVNPATLQENTRSARNPLEERVAAMLESDLDLLLAESVGRVKRSAPPSQTVYQYQKKAKKCKSLRSQGVASGSNALSYMSFVAAVITLGEHQ